MHEADDIVRKDTSNRLTWTATGTHAGTLTIGTIGSTHSNITSTTFTGTATKVTVTNENNPSSDSTARAIPYLNGTDLKTDSGTLKYKPDDGTLTATKFSGELPAGNITGEVPISHGGTGQTEYTAGDILYANNDTTPVLVKLARDNGKFLKSTSTGVEWSPVSASTVPVTDETAQDAEHGLVFVSSTAETSQALEKDMVTLKYNPSTGSLSATKFVGNGSSLTGVIASAVTSEATKTLTAAELNAAASLWQNANEN